MKSLLLALSVLCAGCTADPPSGRSAQRPPPQRHEPQDPEQRETAARADVAAGRKHAAKRPLAGDADGQTWRGLDLSAAPVTTDASRLPDIWEARPAGSKSYEIREEVTVIRPDNIFVDGTVYWIPSRNRFYVQRDPAASSTLHFYGPFEGDPYQVLNPPPTRAVGE